MRILCVIEDLGPGGAQRQLVNLAIALHRRSHVVRVFVYHREDFFDESLRNAGIDVLRSRKSMRWSLWPMVALRAEIHRGAYDVVLSFLSSSNSYAELARTGMRRPRLVVSERSVFDPDAPRGASIRLQLQLHRLADYITTNSHHLCRQLRRLCPWASERITAIWNGVDLIRFTPPDHRCTDGTLRLLVVSNVWPYKNGLRLIEALDILRSRDGLRPSVTWVGEPNHAAGPTFAHMQRQIAERGLVHQWRWLGSTDAVPALMQQHDALIHPSYVEGLPNAICEALASGLPVLASNVLDHPLLVQDGRSGLLFDPWDAHAIAAAVRRFYIMSECERAAMARAGRAFAESRLSIERYVGAYETMLQDVLRCSAN